VTLSDAVYLSATIMQIQFSTNVYIDCNLSMVLINWWWS